MFSICFEYKHLAHCDHGFPPTETGPPPTQLQLQLVDIQPGGGQTSVTTSVPVHCFLQHRKALNCVRAITVAL